VEEEEALIDVISRLKDDNPETCQIEHNPRAFDVFDDERQMVLLKEHGCALLESDHVGRVHLFTANATEQEITPCPNSVVKRNRQIWFVLLGLRETDPFIAATCFRISKTVPCDQMIAGLTSTQVEGFELYLRRPTMVKRLNILGATLTRNDAESRFAAALRGNATLTELELGVSSFQNLGLILAQLEAHPTLEVMGLEGNSLPPDLNWRLPRRVSFVKLLGFHFNRDSFRPVLNAIRSSLFVEKLELDDGCQFDEEATEMFISMVTPTSKGGSAIRSLIVDGREYHDPNDIFYCSFGSAMKRIFTACAIQPTGSQLEEVTLFRSTEGLNVMFQALGTYAASVRLQKLSIFGANFLNENDFQALIECLPKLIHLKNFSLHDSPPQTVDPLRVALKQNGSLVDESNEMAVLLPEAGLYCLRNKLLPALMINPPSDETDSMEVGKTPINLFPKLFHVAQECTTLGPTWMLAGLLKISSKKIGPPTTRKLSRPD